MPTVQSRCRRLRFALPVGVVALFAAGCGSGGPRPVPVSGQVRVAGKPTEGVLVKFLPTSATGRGGLVRTGPDGRFTIGSAEERSGLAAGEYKVTFSHKVGADGQPASHDKPGEAKGGSAPTEEQIPKPYTSVDTTPVTLIVALPESHFDLDVSAK